MKLHACCLVTLLGAVACGGDDGEITSDEEARRAYLGLDGSIEKSLALGFAGFNTATSANIDPQSGVGDIGGSLTITGQVDAGVSTNKEMRLRVGMVDYNDGEVVLQYEGETLAVDITYNTSADELVQPYLVLSLRNIPDGTFTGTLTGLYTMTGDLSGDANLDLMFSGSLMSDGAGGTLRVPGSTTVTGTATSGDGSYDVNLQL
jgi:hypothetical protein